MRKDKALAIKLRRSDKSYSEISKKLGISKSTLAEWFRHDPLSQKTKQLLTRRAAEISRKRMIRLGEINKIRWEKWRESARNEGRKLFPTLVQNPLFIAGLMLYWAEGDSKIENPFRLTNTNPKMIALYIRFLTKILRVPIENLRATVILYPDLSEKECLRFWEKTMGISESQFYKTQFIKGHHPTKRLSNGICMITCGGRQLKEKVAVWIDLASNQLLQSSLRRD
ncbi:MAG: helix-turn-helix domain-containing protein [Patescibacteria group bacterium]